MRTIEYYFDRSVLYFDRLNHDQWIFLLIGICLLGLYCMRGFGSRSNY